MPCFLSVSRHLFLPSSREFTLPSPPVLALCPSRRTFLPHSAFWQRCRFLLGRAATALGAHRFYLKCSLLPLALSDPCVARKGSERGLNRWKVLSRGGGAKGPPPHITGEHPVPLWRVPSCLSKLTEVALGLIPSHTPFPGSEREGAIRCFLLGISNSSATVK